MIRREEFIWAYSLRGTAHMLREASPGARGSYYFVFIVRKQRERDERSLLALRSVSPDFFFFEVWDYRPESSRVHICCNSLHLSYSNLENPSQASSRALLLLFQ